MTLPLRLDGERFRSFSPGLWSFTGKMRVCSMAHNPCAPVKFNLNLGSERVKSSKES